MNDFDPREICEYIPQAVFEVSLAYGVSPGMHIITAQVDQGPLIPMTPKSAVDDVAAHEEEDSSGERSAAIQNTTR